MTTAKILIVEDEDMIVKMVQRMLNSLGYAVPVVVDSGEDAIKAAEALCPDLVLMDIALKGEMDGVEAANQIRAQFNIPIVYLTAYANEEILQRAKITEPFGYLIKPFHERDLHTTIEIALYKHKLEEQLKKTKQWLTAIIKNMGDAMIVLDQDTTIKTFNLAAEKIFGYQSSEILGKPFRQLFSKKEFETIIIKRAKAVDNYVAELPMQRKDTSLFPAKLHVSTIQETLDNPSTYIIVVWDLGVEKELEKLRDAFSQTKDKLMTVLGMLDRVSLADSFISAISHLEGSDGDDESEYKNI